MPFTKESQSAPFAQKFAFDLLTLLMRPDSNGEIAEESWLNDDLIDRGALRNSWAGCIQSLAIFKALCATPYQSEEQLKESFCKNSPVCRLLYDQLFMLRDVEGWELEWYTLDHYFHDILNQLEADWALRHMQCEDADEQ